MGASYAVITLLDAMQLGTKFLQAHGGEASTEVIRRACEEAFVDIINAYDWPSLEHPGRLHMNAGQSGQCVFSAADNTVTLPGTLLAVGISGGAVVAMGVSNPGVYTYLGGESGTIPVNFSGGGSGAAAVANITDGLCMSVTVTDGGSGYSDIPWAWLPNDVVWPAWIAANGSVRLDNVLCEVQRQCDPLTILLDPILNLGYDYTGGYDAMCRWYPLPWDFVNFTGPLGRNRWAYAEQRTLTEILAFQRNHQSIGYIRSYAIGEQLNNPAQKGLYIWPFAIEDDEVDFTYNRRPRELQYTGLDAVDSQGTITTTAGSTTVTGVGTAFDARMAGSMLMVGNDATTIPTGRYGLSPFAEQLRIASVSGPLAMTLAAPAASTRLTAVKYAVTDPVDIEPATQNAYLRCVEYHLAMARNLDKNAQGGYSAQFQGQYEKALREAMAAAQPVRYDPSRGMIGPMLGREQYIAPSTWGIG